MVHLNVTDFVSSSQIRTRVQPRAPQLGCKLLHGAASSSRLPSCPGSGTSAATFGVFARFLCSASTQLRTDQSSQSVLAGVAGRYKDRAIRNQLY